MMQTILDRIDFTNLDVLGTNIEPPGASTIEGLPIVTVQGFYGHGLKSPEYYKKHPTARFPYLYSRRNLSNAILRVKISYDPRYIVAMTGYLEMSGHYRLVCYGFAKRVRVGGNSISLDLMPLAIGIPSSISQVNAAIRAI
jgi:hypothetical protein